MTHNDPDQVLMSARLVGPAHSGEEEHLMISTSLGLSFRFDQGLIASITSLTDCCKASVRTEHREQELLLCFNCDEQVRGVFSYLAYENPNLGQDTHGLTLNISSHGELYNVSDAVTIMHSLLEDKTDSFTSIIVARDLITYLINLTSDVRALDFSWWKNASDVYQGRLDLAISRTPFYPQGKTVEAGILQA